MGKKIITPKKLAIIMALITLVSFIYKFTIGVLATSLIMIIAALPTLMVFVCKASFAKNMNQTREDKRRAYFIMTIAATCIAALFIMFSTLKIGGIDITNQNRFEGWIGLIFIFFIIVMFVLSIINLKGALNKTDLVVIGIKEVTFMSALADAIMIQQFLYRVLLKYLNLPFMGQINRFFPFAIAVLMIIVPIQMFRRYFGYTS